MGPLGRFSILGTPDRTGNPVRQQIVMKLLHKVKRMHVIWILALELRRVFCLALAFGRPNSWCALALFVTDMILCVVKHCMSIKEFNLTK